MENYNNNLNNFNDNNNDFGAPQYKEKNMYLLHLDGPRILILSSILIGLIVVTFLIGMRYTGDTDNTIINNDIATTNNMQLGSKNSSDKKSLDELFEEKEAEHLNNDLINNEDKPLDDEALLADKSTNNKNNDNTLLVDKTETLTPEDNKPTKKIVRDAKPKIKKSSPKKTKIAANKSNKRKPKRIKSRVIAVAATKPRIEKVRPIAINNSIKKGYSVQVVSYDSIRKAKNEVKKLSSLNYTAYTNKARVNGRQFYRVLVGPIKSKRNAVMLLKEIQDNPRYENSYIIHK